MRFNFRLGQRFYDSVGVQTPQAVLAAGGAGALRYGCPENTATAFKLLRAPELAAFLAYPLNVPCHLIFEWYAARSAVALTGGTDGVFITGYADRIGYPKDWPIYYAGGDFAPTSAQLPVIAENFEAWCQVVVRRGNPVGFYVSITRGEVVRIAEITGG